MNSKEIQSALLTFFIFFGSALGVLFAGDDVSELTDINQVQYVGALIAAAVAGLKDIQSNRRDSTRHVAG